MDCPGNMFHLTRILLVALFFGEISCSMTVADKESMRLKVKEMFKHAFSSYMNHAFPADELMPLSCAGRYRSLVNSRGDIDDSLGNFSLTLIDSLDSLFIFADFDAFETAVKDVITKVSFDSDIDVSVFEANIRVLGGLLGGHVSALAMKNTYSPRLSWYSDQLLQLAIDIGNRLLPAFQTSTGIPLPRINLRHGKKRLRQSEAHTCTACAGTMLLEFVALSRLSGDPIYESVATRAMTALWLQRSRYSGLMGHVINVHSGDWVRRESGIGAGFDSYYEYLLKAYILLGEPVYLHRFHTHYTAIKRFVGGPQSSTFPFLFLDVHMHRPSEKARTFMDALFAFWPGVQVMTGDLRPAIALHEFLFQVHKFNKMLPEAFTADLKAHWGEHLLRPELIESTYFLYQATRDPYYLDVGAQIVDDIERYCRVPCGFAAIENVSTMKHLDRLDSYVLAETFKYLYLLFAEPSHLPVNLDGYIFTTEAHLLPLSISQIRYPDLSKSYFRSVHNTDFPLLNFSTHHHLGDRDYVTEETLHRRATCPSMLTAFSKCGISTIGASSDFSFPTCKHSEDPRLPRTIAHLLFPTSSESHLPSCNSVSVPNKQLWHNIELIRLPLRQLSLTLSQPRKPTTEVNLNSIPQSGFPDHIPLRAADFQFDNPGHLELLKHMGIEISVESNGQLVLRHDQSNATNAQLAVAGLLFIHELLNLNRARRTENQAPVEPRYVAILNPPAFGQTPFRACPAQFGYFPGESDRSTHEPEFRSSRATAWKPVIAPLRVVEPLDGCSEIAAEGAAFPSPLLDWNAAASVFNYSSKINDLFAANVTYSLGSIKGSVGIVRRGGCLFVEKARNLMRAGAIGGIVVDIDPSTSAMKNPAFAMSGDAESNDSDIVIPVVLLFGVERDKLLSQMRTTWLQFHSPTVVMLSKQYNYSAGFLASLHQFHLNLGNDAYEVNTSFEPFGTGHFKLLAGILKPYFPFPPKNHLLTITSGGLLISPCPTVQHCSFQFKSPETDHFAEACCNCHPTWYFTLLVTPDELNNYYGAFSPDIAARAHRNWLLAVQTAIVQTHIGQMCQNFLIAVFNEIFRNTPHSMFWQSSTLNSRWTLNAQHCLTRLMKHAELTTIFSRNGLPIDHFLQVSLTLSFHPVLVDVT